MSYNECSVCQNSISVYIYSFDSQYSAYLLVFVFCTKHDISSEYPHEC